MLARSAWTWIVLIATWASLVASKSPAAAYELIFGYHVYNTAWKYRGAGQGIIYRQLDPEKDKTLFKQSYGQKGHKGSLAEGQMDWKEFTLAWLRNNKIGPQNIPDLDPTDLTKTAQKLWEIPGSKFVKLQLATGTLSEVRGKGPEYHTVLKGWSDMVKEARGALGDSKIAAELEGIRLASERATFIRRAEFSQVEYLGEELVKDLPGIEIKSKLVSIDEFNDVRKVVDVQATLTDPKNRENIPKALGLSSSDDWVSKFIQKVDQYGMLVGKPEEEMTRSERAAFNHQRVLATVEGFQRAAGKNVCK
ncbi:uncharacterized protein B0T23DRAFT_315024 [Neurospora hispaniola]|uniref:Uncharacterized protein n=1 Tax=Neurospora hispaniola TaxID=588809 RepID=A0AAJ0MRX2_9PEZI|nr:hypothetical protein B0T23DRAFT_315024 [Neurospora hispaniola]